MTEVVLWVRPIRSPKNNHPIMRTAEVVEVWIDGHMVGTIKPAGAGIRISGSVVVEHTP